MSVNSLGSSTALFGGLVQQMERTVRGETTTSTPDGGSVTTVGTGPNANIVSVTSPGGETATEAGFVSPVLLQGFLDSLFQVLGSDGPGGAASSSGATGSASQSSVANSSSDTTTTSDATGKLSNSLQTLIQQLGPSEPSTPLMSNLLASFDSLMQGSGIFTSRDSQDTGAATSDRAAKAALQAFLSNAMPTTQGSNEKTTASSVNVTT